MKEFINGREYHSIFKSCQNGSLTSDAGYRKLIELISRLSIHGSFRLIDSEIVYVPNIYAWTEYSFKSSSIIRMSNDSSIDRDRALRDAQDVEIRTAIRIVMRLNDTFDELNGLGKELKEWFFKREIEKMSRDTILIEQHISKRYYYKLRSAAEWAVKKKFHLFNKFEKQ